VGLRSTYKTIVTVVARVLSILTTIGVPRARLGEVVMTKVIEFYIPKNFRRPMKRDPEIQRGKLLDFCALAKKSA
jgi:hypothetical protein